MARPRKKDKHLPPCTYHRHGAYWHVKGGKWTRLGSKLTVALEAYGRLVEGDANGMAEFIDAGLATVKPRLAEGSWRQYLSVAKHLKTAFMDFAPESLTIRDVRRFKRGMIGNPVTCNLCLTVLRQVYEYAVEEELVDTNPAVGVKAYATPGRKRNVKREEYALIYSKADPELQVIMDLLYLTGQRVMAVVGIKLTDLLDEGIYFPPFKTGFDAVTVRWTPELRAVVERAKKLHGNVAHLKATTLLYNRRGEVIDYDAINVAWRKANAAAGVEYTQMRDLRAMSGTAVEKQGKSAQKLLGHRDERMTRRYLRDRDPPVVVGPNFGQASKTKKKTSN